MKKPPSNKRRPVQATAPKPSCETIAVNDWVSIVISNGRSRYPSAAALSAIFDRMLEWQAEQKRQAVPA